VESKLGSLGISATNWPIVPAFGGTRIGRRNRSTRRKPAPAPLCSLQITIEPDWNSNLGRRGGKPATNRLSYGEPFPRITFVH
jgi:hypothetical protein